MKKELSNMIPKDFRKLIRENKWKAFTMGAMQRLYSSKFCNYSYRLCL